MKFGQSIEYNMRNIFLEKLYTHVAEKLFPDLFLKRNQWSNVLYRVFLLYVKLRTIEIYSN